MSECPLCHGKSSFSGEIIHKAGCANKPKAAAVTCTECGGAKTLRGFQHRPNCSKNPVPVAEDFLLRSIGIV